MDIANDVPFHKNKPVFGHFITLLSIRFEIFFMI